MAHPCGDPNRATQCRASSVASNSRRIRDVAPKSRYTPPPQIKVSHLSLDPLSHFPLIRSRHGVWRAGGGYRGTFGFRTRIALQGGIAATITPVALLCATKVWPRALGRNFSFFLRKFGVPGFWKELFRTFRVPHYNQGSYQNLTLVRLAYANA